MDTKSSILVRRPDNWTTPLLGEHKETPDRADLEPWENPGWAEQSQVTLVKKEGEERKRAGSGALPEHRKLGQLTSTSICGNDILSSCLYTAGLVAQASGVFAPVSLFMVAVMLYFFRAVYGEVVTALPLNGGAYNVLLNTTSKATASIAACLTILSYVATGVVSATSACWYLHNLVDKLDVYWATIILLCAFAFLNLMYKPTYNTKSHTRVPRGITESATVAALIFCIHCAVLTLLLLVCANWLFTHGFSRMGENFRSPLQPTLLQALFYGFSASSLGITGFETSANFVEEQKEGVFPKTLRNMWALTMVFNPLLSMFSMGIVPIADVKANNDVLLSRMGFVCAGRWLEVLVSADAFLVLSGSIITAFVGVTGLVKRLAGDRCLPAVLLTENKWRGTNHYIILSFLAICVSMFAVLHGEVSQLSAVYSISFLSVMSLFAVGDMLLKFKRNAIPRSVRSSWLSTITAFVMVCFAIVATVMKEPTILNYFIVYFFATACVFAVTFWRIQVLKVSLYFVRKLFRHSRNFREQCDRFITRAIRDINSQSVVFFAKSDSLAQLNKAILYIRSNEHTHWVRIVHCSEVADDEISSSLAKNVELLNAAYPKIRVDCVLLKGSFDRRAVDTIAHHFGVPFNMMFITCPGSDFRHKISTLGGVRIITHNQSANRKDEERDRDRGREHEEMRRRSRAASQASVTLTHSERRLSGSQSQVGPDAMYDHAHSPDEHEHFSDRGERDRGSQTEPIIRTHSQVARAAHTPPTALTQPAPAADPAVPKYEVPESDDVDDFEEAPEQFVTPGATPTDLTASFGADEKTFSTRPPGPGAQQHGLQQSHSGSGPTLVPVGGVGVGGSLNADPNSRPLGFGVQIGPRITSTGPGQLAATERSYVPPPIITRPQPVFAPAIADVASTAHSTSGISQSQSQQQTQTAPIPAPPVAQAIVAAAPQSTTTLTPTTAVASPATAAAAPSTSTTSSTGATQTVIAIATSAGDSAPTATTAAATSEPAAKAPAAASTAASPAADSTS